MDPMLVKIVNKYFPGQKGANGSSIKGDDGLAGIPGKYHKISQKSPKFNLAMFIFDHGRTIFSNPVG